MFWYPFVLIPLGFDRFFGRFLWEGRKLEAPVPICQGEVRVSYVYTHTLAAVVHVSSRSALAGTVDKCCEGIPCRHTWSPSWIFLGYSSSTFAVKPSTASITSISSHGSWWVCQKTHGVHGLHSEVPGTRLNFHILPIYRYINVILRTVTRCPIWHDWMI